MSMTGASTAPLPRARIEPARFGVWLFLVSEAMFFAALIAAFLAVVARRQGREARITSSWVRRTLLFGALFLAMQVAEYRTLLQHDLSPRTSLYWSCFFVLTSVHALHVLGGLAWLGAVWPGTRRGAAGLGVELAGLYWHLVDLVWLCLFALLYW
jgi:heme/copper-type cytochrome/quinol oxidase subunit 3